MQQWAVIIFNVKIEQYYGVDNKRTIKHHIYFILNTAKYKEYLGQTH